MRFIVNFITGFIMGLFHDMKQNPTTSKELSLFEAIQVTIITLVTVAFITVIWVVALTKR